VELASKRWRLALRRFGAALRKPSSQEVDAGESGERLVARLRLIVVGLLGLLQLVPVLRLDGVSPSLVFNMPESVVGRWATGACLLASVLLWLAARYAFRPWLKLVSIAVDITMVSAGLAVFLVLDRPLTAVNSRVIFEVYFLAIAASGLRYDWRLCVAASALAVTQYLGLCLYANAHWNLRAEYDADPSYGIWGWGATYSRLVLLGIAGVVGAAIAIVAAAAKAEVEARLKEVRALNSEVRRQVAERARNLAASLMQLPDAPASGGNIVPGEVIDGRYRLIRPLGQGGMGVVYEVERLQDGRRLALKLMVGVAQRSSQARFAREAQVAAQLDHPNVVSTLDLGVTSTGVPFLVMELVNGTTLHSERPRYGDVNWCLPVLAQVARALSAMHEQGIVHRDLKPSNVLIDGTVVKVADFGIAALVETEPGLANLTRTGMLAGTPPYMAPEFATGAREVGSTADIFSFGVLCFEVLSGRLPHAVPPVLEASFGRSPLPPEPLERIVPTVPPALARLIDACLQLQPASRPTAREAMEILESVGSELPAPVSVARAEAVSSSERDTMPLDTRLREG
jgi:serine/threonine-protein kinase